MMANAGSNSKELSRDSLRKSLIELFSSEDVPLDILASIHSDLEHARALESQQLEDGSNAGEGSRSVNDFMKYSEDPEFVETVCNSIHQRTGTSVYEFLNSKEALEPMDALEEDNESSEEIFEMKGLMNGAPKSRTRSSSRNSPVSTVDRDLEHESIIAPPREAMNSVPEEAEKPRRAADPPGMSSSEVIQSPRKRPSRRNLAEEPHKDASRVRVRKKKVGDVPSGASVVKVSASDCPTTPNGKLSIKLVRKKRSSDCSVASKRSVGSSTSRRSPVCRKAAEDMSDVSVTDFSEREKEDGIIRPIAPSSKKIGSRSEHRSKSKSPHNNKKLGKMLSDRNMGRSSRSVVRSVEFPSPRTPTRSSQDVGNSPRRASMDAGKPLHRVSPESGKTPHRTSMDSGKSPYRKMKGSRHGSAKKSALRRKLERQDSDLSFAEDNDHETRPAEDVALKNEVLACLEKVRRECDDTKSLKDFSKKPSSSSQSVSSHAFNSSSKPEKKRREALRKSAHGTRGESHSQVNNRPTPPCRILTKSSSLKDMTASWAEFEDCSPDDFISPDDKTVKTSSSDEARISAFATPARRPKGRVYVRSSSMRETTSPWREKGGALNKPTNGGCKKNSLDRAFQGRRNKIGGDSDEVSIGEFSVNRKWTVNLNSPAKRGRRQLNGQSIPAL